MIEQTYITGDIYLINDNTTVTASEDGYACGLHIYHSFVDGMVRVIA